MDKIILDRRSFLKASAPLGSKFLAGATGLASLTNCSSRSEWRSIHYPKILLDNFRLFDGVKNGLMPKFYEIGLMRNWKNSKPKGKWTVFSRNTNFQTDSTFCVETDIKVTVNNAIHRKPKAAPLSPVIAPLCICNIRK